ncbi:MAG: dihydroneopterin aldolase [Candidatus Berkiella sp.]
MDSITLTDIKIHTLIGIHSWEQQVPQTLRIDVTFQTDAKAIAQTDTISQAIDYEQIVNEIFAFAKIHGCKLIETFADKLATILLERFPTKEIRLALHKPGALKDAKDVIISITRSR